MALDTFTPRIVGRAMVTHLRTELVLQALNLGLWQRRPAAVIHRSDQGSQYTSIAFGQRCREAGVRPSMGSVAATPRSNICHQSITKVSIQPKLITAAQHHLPNRGNSRSSDSRIAVMVPTSTPR